MGVLGFPQAAGRAQRVPHRAVGLVAALGPQFRRQRQSLGVIGAKSRHAVLKRGADVFFVVDAAELDQLGYSAPEATDVVLFSVRT